MRVKLSDTLSHFAIPLHPSTDAIALSWVFYGAILALLERTDSPGGVPRPRQHTVLITWSVCIGPSCDLEKKISIKLHQKFHLKHRWKQRQQRLGEQSQDEKQTTSWIEGLESWLHLFPVLCLYPAALMKARAFCSWWLSLPFRC